MEFGRLATIRRSLARGRKALIFHTEKTMHREGYIMQKVTSYGNMSEAFVTIDISFLRNPSTYSKNSLIFAHWNKNIEKR